MVVKDAKFVIRDIPFAAMGGVYQQDDVEAVIKVVQAAS